MVCFTIRTPASEVELSIITSLAFNIYSSTFIQHISSLAQHIPVPNNTTIFRRKVQ